MIVEKKTSRRRGFNNPRGDSKHALGKDYICDNYASKWSIGIGI